jgi:hypothetical protein
MEEQGIQCLYKMPTWWARIKKKKKVHAHIKCFKCGDIGHHASKCSTKLEKKAQATHERQGNEKQYKGKEDKALTKRNCYSCWEKGHMANSCPLSNTPKPISIDDNIILRKDDDGTSLVAIIKYPALHTKAMPKYVVPNLRGPQTSLGTIKKWMNVYRYHRHWRLDSIVFLLFIMCWIKLWSLVHIQTQCQVKIEWSPSSTIYKCYNSSCGDLLEIFDGLQIWELKLANWIIIN